MKLASCWVPEHSELTESSGGSLWKKLTTNHIQCDLYYYRVEGLRGGNKVGLHDGRQLSGGL